MAVVPLPDLLHAMQFRTPPPPQVRTGAQPNGLLRVTVVDRRIPLVTAAYGTWVARPVRTTMLQLVTAVIADQSWRPGAHATQEVTSAVERVSD
jgi:hypothetical protein